MIVKLENNKMGWKTMEEPNEKSYTSPSLDQRNGIFYLNSVIIDFNKNKGLFLNLKLGRHFTLLFAEK